MINRKSRTMLLLSAVIAVLSFSACSSVNFEYNNPDYLKMQLSKIPPQFLTATITLDEKGTTLLDHKFTVAEFVAYIMASTPLEPNSWITSKVTANNNGGIITFKVYTRGKVVLVNTVYLSYQNGYREVKVDKILWDDKMFGQKEELTTLEEKAGYAMLLLTYMSFQ